MHPSLSGEGKFLVRGYRPNQQASGCLTLRSFEEAEVEAFRPHKPSMSTYRQSLMEMEAMEAARHVAPSVFSTLFFFLIVISRGLLRLAGRGLSPLWVVVPAYSTKRFSCRSKFERLKGPDRELLELRAWAQAQRAWEPVRTASLHGREHLCNFGVPVRCAETASLPKTTALPKPEGEEELGAVLVEPWWSPEKPSQPSAKPRLTWDSRNGGAKTAASQNGPAWGGDSQRRS